MSEKWNREMRLQRDKFVREILVGDCPRCRSSNTHVCSAPDFVPDIEGKPMKIGSECSVARMLDDPCIGHCDDCDYLWCLECGSELSMDNPNCGHWAICGECAVEEVKFSLTEEDLDKLWVCLADLPEDACPFEAQVFDCPKIQEWKENRERDNLFIRSRGKVNGCNKI
jgi:hypothetical protein